MKKLIRKWLGIDVLYEDQKTIEGSLEDMYKVMETFTSKDQVEALILKHFTELKDLLKPAPAPQPEPERKKVVSMKRWSDFRNRIENDGEDVIK